VRWWCYPLEEESTLLVLAEGSDQQRYLKQQAFIGQLVHELRTPLTALVTHSEVVASPKSSEAVKAASTATIQNSAQRMAGLVRDMLELHRLETNGELSLQPTSLALVAEDAIAQLILRAESKEVSVNFEAAMPLPQVLAHPDRLRQVFLNLLDNAIKFCRPGEEICVRLEAQNGRVLCMVKDSGPGIPPADLPHITECFYRGHSEVEGNGIGLALVKEILRQHNATLNIESETQGAAHGTTFSWCLPSLQ
jgi:signal transduction histidine kinase